MLYLSNGPLSKAAVIGYSTEYNYIKNQSHT